MDRRSFLGSILALGAAPAIVKAENLMKLWVPRQEIITPLTFDGDGDFTVDFTVEAWVKQGMVVGWHHVAEVRKGDRLIYLVDGKEVPVQAFIDNGGSRIKLNRDNAFIFDTDGYGVTIDDLRVSKVARY